ncbi:MAG: hypothetical protein PHG89_10870 [Gallionella sp.]|nr:hypothetical protein [Gallionella sp.]
MSENNVIPLGVVTRLDLPVKRIFDAAEPNLDRVVVLGWDRNGELYFASSFADGGDVLWLLEKCKKALMGVE